MTRAKLHPVHALECTPALITARDLYGKGKIIPGGAPRSSEYAKDICADAYSFDGTNALDYLDHFVAANQ